jgi:hypothetical protein
MELKVFGVLGIASQPWSAKNVYSTYARRLLNNQTTGEKH